MSKQKIKKTQLLNSKIVLAASLAIISAFVLIIFGSQNQHGIATTAATQNDKPIYTNALESGWENWSWDGTVDLKSLNQYGNYSISFRPKKAYAGLYLHTNTSIDSSAYYKINFQIKSGSQNQRLRVFAYGPENKPLTSGEYLSGYLPTDKYKNYSVDLKALNPKKQPIKGFSFQLVGDNLGSIFYVDNIYLNSATPTTPSPTSIEFPPIIPPTVIPTTKPTTFTTTQRVLVYDFNPIISNGQRIRELVGWTDPKVLETQYVNTMRDVSWGNLNYQIVQRFENIDDILTRSDGYNYSPTDFYNVARGFQTPHSPVWADYNAFIKKYSMCETANAQNIDEIWLWGAPWQGFYEANMTGPGAFTTNGPVILGTTCNHKVSIMGFSYERGLSEMLEDQGHRFEGTMNQVFKEEPRPYGTPQNTAWGKFVAACGWMHRPPNTLDPQKSEYNYVDSSNILTTCPQYQTYPNMSTNRVEINCRTWSCDGLEFKKWWFKLIPHADGRDTTGKLNNWWPYITNFDKAIQ